MEKSYFLKKSANIEDLATGEATEEFVFRKIGGGLGRIALKRSDLEDSSRLRSALLDRNAKLPALPFANDLIEKAIAAKPEKLIGKARAYGWQGQGAAFLHATGVIECNDADRKTLHRKLHQPGWVNDNHTLTQVKLGTAKQWTEDVASRAIHSSAAIIAICASCAAPLLQLTGSSSFGINLFGRSKAGKTTALLAGSSFGGIGDEADLPNHQATKAAKLELARIFNDQMLPLNEVGLLDGAKKDAYTPIRALIYNINQGRDRIRLSQTQTAVAASYAKFRVVFVSTSESSIDAYARLAKQTRDAGEYARCTDIATAFDGHETIMDRLPAHGTRKEFRQAARKETIALRNACKVRSGAAFRVYIRYLMRQTKLKTVVENRMNFAMKCLSHDGLDGAWQHAAGNFALLYAGGTLAIDAGLIKLEKIELLDVIAGAFHRSVSDAFRSEDPKRAMKRTLRDSLSDLAAIPARQDLYAAGSTVVGFREQVDGRTRYTIRSSAFRQWFGDRHDMVDAALEWLASKGVLKPKNGRATGDGAGGIEWAITTPKWPQALKGGGSKSTRSIVFFDPFVKS